jgi:hypothetical protein
MEAPLSGISVSLKTSFKSFACAVIPSAFGMVRASFDRFRQCHGFLSRLNGTRARHDYDSRGYSQLVPKGNRGAELGVGERRCIVTQNQIFCHSSDVVML